MICQDSSLRIFVKPWRIFVVTNHWFWLHAFCSTFTQVIVYSFTISKISSHDVPKKARRGLPPSLILLCFCQTLLLVSIISVFVLGLHFSLWHSKITKFENYWKMSQLNFFESDKNNFLPIYQFEFSREKWLKL